MLCYNNNNNTPKETFRNLEFPLLVHDYATGPFSKLNSVTACWRPSPLDRMKVFVARADEFLRAQHVL